MRSPEESTPGGRNTVPKADRAEVLGLEPTLPLPGWVAFDKSNNLSGFLCPLFGP